MARKILYIIAALSILALPLLTIASDVQQHQSTMYPYQSTIELQDDFIGGLTTSGAVGGLGWKLSNGTVAVQVSEANRPGIVRRDTSAVSGTTAALLLYNSSLLFSMTQPINTTFITRLNTNDANTTVRQGLRDNSSGLQPTEGVYFEKVDADTNWFCISRMGGVETRTDSTIAVSTNFAKFQVSKNSSGTTFKINGATVCNSPVSTNQPTGLNNFTVNITNSAAASKTIDIDYFDLTYTGLTR